MITYVTFGIGFGMLNAPITNTAVSGHAPRPGGCRGGGDLHRPSGRPGLGVAVVGTVVTWALHGPLRAGGFTQASQAAWWIITGCSAAVLLIGLLTTGRWALGTAARTAERIMADEARVPVSVTLTCSARASGGGGGAGGRSAGGRRRRAHQGESGSLVVAD